MAEGAGTCRKEREEGKEGKAFFNTNGYIFSRLFSQLTLHLLLFFPPIFEIQMSFIMEPVVLFVLLDVPYLGGGGGGGVGLF